MDKLKPHEMSSVKSMRKRGGGRRGERRGEEREEEGREKKPRKG